MQRETRCGNEVGSIVSSCQGEASLTSDDAGAEGVVTDLNGRQQTACAKALRQVSA